MCKVVTYVRIKATPAVTSCVTLTTTLPSQQVTTSSHLIGVTGWQSLSQFLETREPAQVTTSFVLPTVSHYTEVPRERETVTSTRTPQMVSYSACPVLWTNLPAANPSMRRADPPVPLIESSVQQRGKAPLIDTFTGEDSKIRFEDIRKSGHLEQLDRSCQDIYVAKWNLITPTEHSTC